MQEIIASNDRNYNSLSSESILTTTNLPSFHLKLLIFYYVLRINGIDKADYSRPELAQRFKRSQAYISTCLNELEAWGFMASSPHGSRFKRRWITFEGFSMLEGLPQHQIQHQIKSIPYIDLLRSEIRDNLKILKVAQSCGKLKKSPPVFNFEQAVNNQDMALHEKTIIKHALNRSQITPDAISRLINRVGWVFNNRPIQSKRAYFLKAIQNEERFLI